MKRTFKLLAVLLCIVVFALSFVSCSKDASNGLIDYSDCGLDVKEMSGEKFTVKTIKASLEDAGYTTSEGYKYSDDISYAGLSEFADCSEYLVTDFLYVNDDSNDLVFAVIEFENEENTQLFKSLMLTQAIGSLESYVSLYRMYLNVLESHESEMTRAQLNKLNEELDTLESKFESMSSVKIRFGIGKSGKVFWIATTNAYNDIKK